MSDEEVFIQNAKNYHEKHPEVDMVTAKYQGAYNNWCSKMFDKYSDSNYTVVFRTDGKEIN